MRWAVLISVTLFSTAAAGEPELLFTARWGGEAGLEVAGGKESPVRGPTSAALDPLGNIWILDNLNNRLVGFDQKGSQIGVVLLSPGHRDDLAIGPDGSFALLSMHIRQIEILDRDGRPRGFLKLSPLLAPLGRISFPGEIEINNAHGERFRLGTADHPRPVKQVLFGRRFDCGIRVDAGAARLYTQEHSGGPVLEGKRAYRITDLDLGSVASARPVTDCTQPGFLLEVERLGGGTRVEVEREVALVRDLEVQERWSVEGTSLYESFRRFSFLGRVVIMIRPVESGLQVWRWRLP